MGDGDTVSPIAAELQDRAVEIGPDDRCRSIRVRVERSSDAYRIVREDPGGDGTSRLVHEPRTLIALIESWARGDLAAPLLDPSLIPPPPSNAAAEPPVALPAASQDQAPATAPTAISKVEASAAAWALAAGGEVGWTGGGDPELGVVASLALRKHAIEPLLTMRWGQSGAVLEAGLPAARRWTTELLVGARAPWRLGAISIAPGLGLGLGLDGTRRDSCRGCSGPVVPDDASVTRAELRAEGSIGVLAALSKDLSLDFALSASASPLASGEPSIPGWAADLGDDARHFGLPPAPRFRLRAAAGLSWGRW
ncbi:hypothetical protein AKJ08_1320 [Vulgatibacter incomptus]|uniref:Uncharacterized protein n=1 Tax=Vulgatibacter incomptus TaxID=1391653 RepID=A0A0K1PBL9_9BACT|nr:hypothetical protein AKJ08_1320 [Vulgatibacter incomptus]